MNERIHTSIGGAVPPEQPAHKRKRKLRKHPVFQLFTLFVFGSVLFAAGFGAGSGRLALSFDQLYRRSVQKDSARTLDFSSVQNIYTSLRNQYDGQLDDEKILDGLKSGLVAATGDPYTEYLNKKEAEEFDNQLSGTFSGIGAELGKDAQNNLVVIAPISGFPAEKAGLRAQDIIAEVNGEYTNELTVSEAVNKIRGEKGTEVKLTIVRNKTEQIELKIIRDTITIPSVESKILDGNIGYLKISRFGEDTTLLATNASTEFKAKNVRGIIVDVRNDPGGLLDASVGVSGLWLPRGKVILQEKRDGKVIKTFNSTGNGILNGIPTIILINEGSASASEIVAGALRDNGAAKLMGTKTFGKGSVQQLERFADGSVLKVTIARWFTPKGINIDKEGIKPDVEVKRTDDDFKNLRDPQLDAAIAALK